MAELDNTDPKSILASATIRNALIAAAPQIVLILTVITGHAFDVDVIKQWIDDGYLVIGNFISLYYIYRTIKARINATHTIKKD